MIVALCLVSISVATPVYHSAIVCVYAAGGGGGVGCFAIQLAKLCGATVITTCGALNEKHVEKIGADFNFNYRGIGEV